MGASEPVVHEVAFRAAEDLVGKWEVGGFMHHTQLRRELAETGGVEFPVHWGCSELSFGLAAVG